MKKNVIAAAILLAAGITASAQNGAKDSLRVINLQEVQVVSTRATAKTPMAFSNVSKEQIKKQNFGQDIPFLLSATPSVLTTSDAGAGVGYTSIRVRGTDATRINVTANGIPMNDAESHSIFWVNTPDFASSLEDLQIQRGAGTSTNGSGAFGGTINMRTQTIPSTPYAEVSGSYGSFRTHKETVKAGTGLLYNRWAFDARLSNIQSDGYRDRATSDLQSYFVQGGYYGERTTFKFITFGGKEKTYLAWDGISRAQLDTARTYNPNGAITDAKGNTTGFYSDQTDNYRQTHYQLLFNQLLSQAWSVNVALHYTDGAGYYQEYKNNRKLIEYGLKPYELDGALVKKSNLIRQKLVESGFGGGVFALNYTDKKLQASLGGGVNHYTNHHYGKVLWVKNYLGDLNPDREYYRNTAKKLDANLYLKANYSISSALHVYADLQFRHISYKIDGTHDKWDDTVDPARLQQLAIDQPFSFLNPKAGLFWQIAPRHTAYASFAIAQKEPTRNNYTDGFFTRLPQPEKMLDYELGYTYTGSRFTAGINLYYMDYTDQLVLNGRLNEIGEPVSENVKDSYRMGIELAAGARLTPWLRWDVNATWSKNRIKDYTAYLADQNWEQQPLNMGSTPIALSPSLMANSNLAFTLGGWSATLQSQYVSRQYLDNLGTKESSLDAYFVNHLHAAYTLSCRNLKSVTLGASLYNLFNTRYETNGYAQTSLNTADGKTVLKHDPRYYPMAGINVLTHLTFRF
ncbi:MAG: TonB-dependent receptor [Bacteroides sp.]